MRFIYFIFFLVFQYNYAFAIFEKEEENALKKIEIYLNDIVTLKANFVQINQHGSLSNGELFIKKPGKFRWDYKDLPILIVANGKSLIYYDKELEQANYVPMQDSIAAILTKKFSNICFPSVE